MIDTRVFYRARGCVLIGPLGCYEKGDHVEVEGAPYEVRRVDPDGAALACVEGAEPLRFPGRNLADATPRQRASVLAQIHANRRAHGLPELDPRSAT